MIKHTLSLIQKMTVKLVIILFILSSLPAFGQTLDEFKKEFEKATEKEFNEENLDRLFREFSCFLTPHSDITQLTSRMKGQEIQKYPLKDFKDEKLYKKSIDDLINSVNSNHRILAYLVIAGSGDESFESVLLEKLKIETEQANLIWAGMALMHINTTHTTTLFDFLVEHETFGDAHMLPLFIQLDKDSLQQTAYERIYSENEKARILAAQILSVTELNPKTERLLKEAVRNWDINIKGYAIYSMKELQIGNLLETLRPFMENKKIRRISLEALANSPTGSDRQYLFDLIQKSKVVSAELLDALIESEQIDNVKYWLKLLYSKQIPEEYYFSVHSRSLLYSDEMLADLHSALKRIKNPYTIHQLVRALENRTDEQSTDILLSFLKHEDSSVRYWAGSALRNNKSPKLVAELPMLIKDSSKRTTALTDLAIQNNVPTLQPVFESIFNSSDNLDWRRSSIEYLSAFPLDRNKEIFRKILEDDDEDTFIKRNATLGLGRLNDTQSVDLIIRVCRQEVKGSDYNAQIYLMVLGMIKGEKAKQEIAQFKNSKEVLIRELVNEILEHWENERYTQLLRERASANGPVIGSFSNPVRK